MIELIDMAPAFSFVTQKNLMPGASSFEPQAFGNASLIMAGEPFSLCFLRDRGQVFVGIGNGDSGWIELRYALEFVAASISHEQLSEPANVAILARLLQEHWDKLALLFRRQQEVLRLQMFYQRKRANHLRKLLDDFSAQ